LNLRPEWLSNPRGTPQRTPGGTLGHGQQDARADQLGAPHPKGQDAPREEDNLALRDERKPAPARLRFEEGDWGDSPKRQAPPKLEGSTSFPVLPQVPRGVHAPVVKEQSGGEGPTESHTGTEGGSASISLNFPGQAPRAEVTFNPQAGPTRYVGPASAGPTQQSWCYDCVWLSLTALSTVTCNLWL
jgi:hypothetical protein